MKARTFVMPPREQKHSQPIGRINRSTFAAVLLAAWSPAIADDLRLNPAVTQETIGETICVPGWTKTQRPPSAYTSTLKQELLRREGLPPELVVDFQLDHRIPLALGGAPKDPRNFVLQDWSEAVDKDDVEVCLARAVCIGKIGLDEARHRIWADWRAAAKTCRP